MIRQSVLHFSYSLFIYYLKITWKTHINHIFSQSCVYCLHVSSVKTFLLCIQLSYSDIRVSLSIHQKFLGESALWLGVWIKHALHESVQLSWYSHLLILDTNKTSGNVSFNLNLDLNLETSVKTHARARIKCRGRIYILLKLILNKKCS